MTSRAESCPPKPTSKTYNRAAPADSKNGTLIQQNAALRGATQAFAARSVQPRTTDGNKPSGAKAAAAAAGNLSRLKSGSRLDVLSSSSRMSLLGSQIRAQGKASQTGFVGDGGDHDLRSILQSGQLPSPVKSPSEMAARAASARASPSSNLTLIKAESAPTKIYMPTDRFAPMANDTMENFDSIEGPGPEEALLESFPAPRPIRPFPAKSEVTGILKFGQSISPERVSESQSPSALASLSEDSISSRRAQKGGELDFSDAVFPTESMTRLNNLPQAQTIPIKDFSSGRGRKRSQTPEIDPGVSLSWTDGNLGSQSQTYSSGRKLNSIDQIYAVSSGSPQSPTGPKARVSWREIPYSQRSTSASGLGRTSPDTRMTVSALADAMVASSLASSRAHSPTNAASRPVAPRRSTSHSSHSFFHLPHHKAGHEISTPTSPIRTLKHTLRKNTKSDDEDEENNVVKRGRRHFIRKHQHKHHEGDRKRWRDKISERERKRYEGVWAANRGLYTSWAQPERRFGDSSTFLKDTDLVLNIVVRDIWERSRLPKDVLEEAWDLVAREDADSLRRDEFVVGLWLIDQRLKGRKLPMRISSSVWASVRHTVGVKISKKPL